MDDGSIEDLSPDTTLIGPYKREPNAKCLVLLIYLKINKSRFKPLRLAGALMTSSVTAFLASDASSEDTCEFVPPYGIP